MNKKKVLVLCTGNSCRSQMAEGYLKFYAGEYADIYSAGIETHGVNPRAIQTMAADGIDISLQTSNHINEYAHLSFDYVITVCDHALEKCPVFPTKTIQLHQNFSDPAKAIGTDADIAIQFERVRNLIKQFCLGFSHQYLTSNADLL